MKDIKDMNAEELQKFNREQKGHLSDCERSSRLPMSWHEMAFMDDWKRGAERSIKAAEEALRALQAGY